MENPQCLLWSFVKVEDTTSEMKQEPTSEDDEQEIVEIEDPLGSDEASGNHTTAEADESLESLFGASHLGSFHYERPAEKEQRRRLRFSEADDLVLLQEVAARNPYKHSSLWKDITHLVAVHAGKNFSVRSVREHTEHLMNVLTMRGEEACLRRTPPEHWRKKKRLLHMVFTIWKREPFQPRSRIGLATTSAPKDTPEALAGHIPGEPSCSSLPEKSPTCSQSCQQPVSSQSTSVTPWPLAPAPFKSVIVPQQGVPVTLRFGSAVQSINCPPLVPIAGMPHLAAASQAPKPPVSSSSSPTVVAQGVAVSSTASTSSASQVVEVVSSCSTSQRSLELIEIPSSPSTVDRGSSPIPVIDIASSQSLECVQSSPTPSQNSSLGSVVDSGVSLPFGECSLSEGSSTYGTLTRRRSTNTGGRARLQFLKRRHREQFVLKKRELDLERRRLTLEGKRLALEERKVRLEEERWTFDRREREEKLLILSEERQHKMTMERRQQNMIDLLLELKNKE